MSRVIHGDVLAGLPQIESGIVQCTVCSPPYWRLRQYHGVQPTQWADGQLVCLGAESDPDSFVRHLVQVFDGVRRVMRDDGVLFVNLGETYASDWPAPRGRQNIIGQPMNGGKRSEERPSLLSGSLKEGDRCGIPERFALAMQASGWCWRDTITWVKRSPMPMSRAGWRWSRCRVKVAPAVHATTRYESHNLVPDDPRKQQGPNGIGDPTNNAQWSPCPGCHKCEPHGGWILRKGRFATTAATEPIFMFTKGGAYFCDSEAASEEVTGGTHGGACKPSTMVGRNAATQEGGKASSGLGLGWAKPTRLPRSYMLLSSEPTKKKHFAAYPSEIPKRLITMATSAGGCCAKCRSPYAPMVESERVPTRSGEATKCNGDSSVEGNRDPERHIARTTVLGYRPTCDCGAESTPCIVLDPFAGTGQTLRAAHHLGREYIGIEASADYLPIIAERVATPLPDRTKKAKPTPPDPRQASLF